MGNELVQSLLLILVLFSASISGCFGENSPDREFDIAGFQIDFTDAADAELRGGEWHTFFLAGEGRSISVPNNVMMFIDDVVIPNGFATVTDEQINGKLLPIPYAEEVRITIVESNGKGKSFEYQVAEGEPIVSGSEWFDKMDFITSVCADSTLCGGYINRWMGSPNPAFERAASFFHGHFEGLGYETHLMRVTDTFSLTQPESLNVIAWKRGYDDSCVQGIGAHMDVALPGGPPGGGTYEGAYDNTAGTVAVMLYAKALLDICLLYTSPSPRDNR